MAGCRSSNVQDLLTIALFFVAHMNPSGVMFVAILPNQLVKVQVIPDKFKYHFVGDISENVRIDVDGFTRHVLTCFGSLDRFVEVF